MNNNNKQRRFLGFQNRSPLFPCYLHKYQVTCLCFPKRLSTFTFPNIQENHRFVFQEFGCVSIWQRFMASLRVGLGRSCLKLNQGCFEDGFDGCLPRGQIVKFGPRGGKLCRPLRVVSGGGAGELVVREGSSSGTSILDHKLAARKRVMDKEYVPSGKIDQWIIDSVKEIVSNIEKAPFLVHIYPEDDLGSARNTKTKVVTEKAESNSWPNIKNRWERGSSIPDGIALVEELKIDDNDDLLGPDEKSGTIGNDSQNCSSTKVFGIVIQERGLTCPACYILKTSSVRSIAGICTHFCMFRVECFGETPDVQLKKQWLL